MPMILNKPEVPNRNKLYFFLVTIFICGIITYNLFGLQIAHGSKYFFDSKNSFSSFSVDRASRGLIYDRNGVKLVENTGKYNLFIVRDESKSDKFMKTIESLNKLFGKNILDLYNTEEARIKNYPNIPEIKLFSKLDYNPYIFQIEANPQNFPFVHVEKTNIRKYLYPELMSHIIGYTGEINEEDYKTGKFNYGDEIGKFGIEKGYDEVLRGQNGIERIDYYGSDGRQVSSAIQQKTNGIDIYLTIDIRYQQKLYELSKSALQKPDLKGVISTASVIEDVKTGQILALASYPTFDANLFASGIKQDEYNRYLNDPGKPLTNKAIQYAQAPGSTFKTVTDMVSLQNGAIDKNTKFGTGGTWVYGGITFQDAGRVNWGDIDVVHGLCYSSNIFHMKTALALEQKSGGRAADMIAQKVTEMGLTKPSDLKIGSEAVGYYPTPKDKEAAGQPWLPGYLLNASIGQGEVRLTPLEVATVATTVATKGNVRKQSIILDRNDPNKVDTHSLEIAPEHYDTINEGMRCAAKRNNGLTAYDITKYPEVSEKTGTAETGQMLNGQELIHAWEITFSPSNKPEIAMSIFLENGGYGYKAGYISREFYKYWSKELRQ